MCVWKGEHYRRDFSYLCPPLKKDGPKVTAVSSFHPRNFVSFIGEAWQESILCQRSEKAFQPEIKILRAPNLTILWISCIGDNRGTRELITKSSEGCKRKRFCYEKTDKSRETWRLSFSKKKICHREWSSFELMNKRFLNEFK